MTKDGKRHSVMKESNTVIVTVTVTVKGFTIPGTRKT